VQSSFRRDTENLKIKICYEFMTIRLLNQTFNQDVQSLNQRKKSPALLGRLDAWSPLQPCLLVAGLLLTRAAPALAPTWAA
jgi:hypothetical protein